MNAWQKAKAEYCSVYIDTVVGSCLSDRVFYHQELQRKNFKCIYNLFCFLYSPGVRLVTFLKIFEKWDKFSNPIFSAISV